MSDFYYTEKELCLNVLAFQAPNPRSQTPNLKRPSHGKLKLANPCWQTPKCWPTRAFTRQTQQR